MMQSPTFVQQLGYGVLRIALLSFFPELRPLFQQIEHGSRGVGAGAAGGAPRRASAEFRQVRVQVRRRRRAARRLRGAQRVAPGERQGWSAVGRSSIASSSRPESGPGVRVCLSLTP